MRKLLYIPIVHNKADLGSLGSQLSLEGERKYGAAAWQEHLENVERSWDRTETEIDARLGKTSFAKVRIYQDGLPVVGDIGMKIVRDAAGSGSKNYLIIERLLAKGASLEQAENKDLLISEYNLLAAISKADTHEKQLQAYRAYQEMSAELLASRDRFIANQINTTLNDGETGIAFFGATHIVTDKLEKDIKVNVIRMFNDPVSLNLVK
jgi:hypothetical protein